MNTLDYDVCAFSADGRYVAAAVADRFVVKRYPFASPYTTAVAAHAIDRLQWNDTSDFILCAQLAKGSLQVYDVRAHNWICTLKCGYFKFIASEWIGHQKILLTLEFHMALAVFDLVNYSFVYVEIPKPISPCIVFNNDGTRMFVVSKINGYEKLFMMHSHSLDKIIYIQDIIGSCAGLSKSPDDRFLCVFNNRKLVILNFLSGCVIGSVDECTFLNVISWAPDGEYLALGCSFGRIVVLASNNEFNVEYSLCSHSLSDNCHFFKESDKILTKRKPSTSFVNNVHTKIASISWSFDCRYLSTFEVDSTFLYIWEKFKLICVVEFSTQIKQMQWCQSENKLSVVCGTELIFFWTKDQNPKLQIPPKLINGKYLLISSVSWSLNNKDIILSDGKKCILFTI